MRALIQAVTLLLGAAGLLAIGGFLWRGAPGWVDLGLAPPPALAWDAALSLVFFVQHSGMVRQATRRWLGRRLPEAYLGAVYTITSGVVLLVVVLLWQPVAGVAWSVPAAWRLPLRVLFLAGAAGMAWGVRAIRAYDLFGLGPLRAATASSAGAAGTLTSPAPQGIPFTVRGPYRWVRHPLYTATLIMLWAVPEASPDRLGFNLLWSTWILLAGRWEERDLVARFGDAYRAYRRRVPMFLPRPWRGPSEPV